MNAPRSPRWRIVAGLGAATAILVIAAAAWLGYRSILEQPVKRVVFTGDVAQVPRAELDALSQAIEQAPAGSVTLEAVREAARRVPWVRDASVRRHFPDAIDITLRAHEAFARWNDGSLLSKRGEVFAAETSSRLPQFRGPEGSGPTMLAQYAGLGAALSPLGSSIVELRLSARGAWQLALDSGVVLELGREDLNARLERFVAAWPQAASRVPESRHADLRYPNGFALGTDPGSRARGPSPVLPPGQGR